MVGAPSDFRFLGSGVARGFVAGFGLCLLAGCGVSTVPNAGASADAAPANQTFLGCDTGSDCENPVQGLPAGGPPILYAPPAIAPQLQNRDPRFKAPYELVSASERYVDGEYSYTDYIYDDEQNYPSDPKYAGNAADLVEYRMATTPDGLAVRFTLNTLVQPDTTIVVVAFDTDHNAATGSSTLPLDPGMPFPGTDQVLTTWGTGAEWSEWTGSAWKITPLQVTTDVEAKQITVTVPDSVAHPTGKWLATLAVGLYDPATGGWLAGTSNIFGTPIPIGSSSAIFNLGFRFSEAPGNVSSQTSDHDLQDQALKNNDPTYFAHDLDFDLLRAHGSLDTVPTHGFLSRIYASRLNTGAGFSSNSNFLQRFAQLVPYAVYIPSSYDPSTPTQMTILLHPDATDYYIYNGMSVQSLFGDQRGSLLLEAGGRSITGFFQDVMEADVFEAWNDMAQHYNLDPQRTSIAGYSMGGHGTFRIGLLYPQLFSRAAPMAAPSGSGIWIPGLYGPSGGDSTLSNRWIENARNLPFFEIADIASELVPYPGQLQQMIGPAAGGLESFEGFQYRYIFWSVTAEHNYLCCNFPEVGDWLGNNTIEQRPFHVTYARMPSNDYLDAGMVHDKAYWLSDIEVADATVSDAKGVVDAVSYGFGLSDPASSLGNSTGLTSPGPLGVPYAYVSQERVWAAPSARPRENRLDLTLTNIGNVLVHAADAQLDLSKPVTVNVTATAKATVTFVGKGVIEMLAVDSGHHEYIVNPGSSTPTQSVAGSDQPSGSAQASLAGHSMIEHDRACQYSGGEPGAVSNTIYYHNFSSSTRDQVTNHTVGGRETFNYDSVQRMGNTLQFRDVTSIDQAGTSYTQYLLTFSSNSSGSLQATIFSADYNLQGVYQATATCNGTFIFN